MNRGSYFDYEGRDGRYVSFPLGGMGAGCVGLSASGRLIDWEIANHPDKGRLNGFTHFAIKAESGGEVLDTRIIHGPFSGDRSGERGAGGARNFGFGVRREHLTGLPHFRRSTFDGFYPTARLTFDDTQFPGTVEMLAFSPFIPMDAKASSLPVAMFEIAVENQTDKRVSYSLTGCLGHPGEGRHRSEFVGSDLASSMVNHGAAAPDSAEYGQVAIATDAEDASFQHDWFRGNWYESLAVYWRELSAPGRWQDRRYEGEFTDRRKFVGRSNKSHSSLAAHLEAAPGERVVFRFALAWHFPNVAKNWISLADYVAPPVEHEGTWKNYYASVWPDVSAVVDDVFSDWDRLREETLAFADALRSSSLPDAVLDAVSANLSILKSPTVLRLSDGTFYGFEGCDVTWGSCEGSCSHVWNYQQALPFLFPDMERGMRAADFEHNLDTRTGAMSFRLALPIGTGRLDMRPCADGQFGNVMKAYRDWKVSGDGAWLRGIWPKVKAALEYAWHPGNDDLWDPDKTGVLWGMQHHTLDMELFGPNSWLTGFYLGALLAAAAMARAVGDNEAADEYEAIFARGKAWIAENLFNGSHFIQKIDLGDRRTLASYPHSTSNPLYNGTVDDLYWSGEFGELKYQVGEGCLLDQIVAQWHANTYGLGEIFDPGQVRLALQSMLRLNFQERLGDVANPSRVYGLEEESGSIVCAWSDPTTRPAIPVPYAEETFHGIEYAFGALLMQTGDVEAGTRVFAAVRDRYRGDNRNPWNELECGSNYARSMASYGGLLALSGFTFDMCEGRIGFDPQVQADGRFRCFWAVGGGWGVVLIEDGTCEVTLLGGRLVLRMIDLPVASAHGALVQVNGADHQPEASAGGTIRFPAVGMKPGDTLLVRHRDLGVRGKPHPVIGSRQSNRSYS